ncbi:MAG: hypothetical protein ACLFRD_09255 [Nitriliruptoraceae bacterium]
MRWLAAGLAAVVAGLQIAMFTLGWLQLAGSLGQMEAATGPAAGLRWLWAGAWVAPWLVGAALLIVGQLRRAVAMLLTVSLLLVTTSLADLAVLAARPMAGLGPTAADWLQRFGGPSVWLLGLLAGVVAWFARPRGAWRWDAPGPYGSYVALAVLAWLPAFRQVAFAPPGAPRRFIEFELTELSGFEAAGSLTGALAAAVVLWVAPRLRPDAAGVVLLTYAVPVLLGDVGGWVQVASEEHMILTPAGVLGPIGLVGIIALGLWWMTRRVSPPPDVPPDASLGLDEAPNDP